MRKILLTAVLAVVILVPLLFAEQISLDTFMPELNQNVTYLVIGGAANRITRGDTSQYTSNIEVGQSSNTVGYPWESKTPAWSGVGLKVPVRTGDLIQVSISAIVLNGRIADVGETNPGQHNKGGGHAFLWPNEGASAVQWVGGTAGRPIRIIGRPKNAEGTPKFWTSLHITGLWSAVADGDVIFRLGLVGDESGSVGDGFMYANNPSPDTCTYIRVLKIFMWAEKVDATYSPP